jgi:C4-dicarboxylate-specific signal transduction histidine kinase
MLPDDSEREIKQLHKEIRILKKKLGRTEVELVRLEANNRTKESLLKRVICELQEYQISLERKGADLEDAFNELTAMKDKLVESEKMVALGSLVVGVAHEINTPVGTSITLASTLKDETQLLLSAIDTGQLKRTTLTHYLDIARESSSLILTNLHRAGELVQSFKQVAVDRVWNYEPFVSKITWRKLSLACHLNFAKLHIS